MNINIKKLISPIIYIASGIFGFIFMAFSYFCAYASYSGEFRSESLANGYKFIGLDCNGSEAEVLATFVKILLVFVIIACVLLIAIGAIKLLKALEIEIPVISDSVINTVSKITPLVYMIVNCVSFIFLLIFGLVNTDESWGMVYGVMPDFGAYFLTIFAVALFVAIIIIDNKFDANDDKPQVAYVCTSCGKKSKPGNKFCDACGAAIAEKVQYPVVYVCTSCGKKAKASDKFCSECGSVVVQKEVYPKIRVCSSCGQKAGAKDNFCAACGGSIVEKILAPEVQQPVED